MFSIQILFLSFLINHIFDRDDLTETFHRIQFNSLYVMDRWSIGSRANATQDREMSIKRSIDRPVNVNVNASQTIIGYEKLTSRTERRERTGRTEQNEQKSRKNENQPLLFEQIMTRKQEVKN
jgi:hypothetical protein